MTSPQQALASLLANAGPAGLRFAELPPDIVPTDAQAAYGVQAMVLALRNCGIAGWKVGSKTPTGPVQGAPLPADGVHPGGVTLPRAAFRPLALELEIAFCFGEDFAPRSARRTPYADDEVLGAISHMAATIEVVASRFADWPDVDRLAQLADFQNHGALVVGEKVPYQADYPFVAPTLAFTFEGDDIAPAPAANPAGDPRRLLPWVVNHCSEQGITLRAGTWVTCGSYTGMHFVETPGTVRGAFDGLPPVMLTLA